MIPKIQAYTEIHHPVAITQQARRRAMIVPREHGAWGLLLVPLFTGLVAGFAPEHRGGALFLFTLATLSLFALRTPLESLLGVGVISARTTEERWTALLGSACFALLAAACLSVLMWRGQYRALFLLGAASAFAFVLQAMLRRWGRGTRVISQVVGAIALTSTAPAAYYIGTGQFDERGFALWIANWMFAGNQIQFVQLRIRSARAMGLKAKLASGQSFLLAQTLSWILLAFGSVWHLLPPLSLIAFLPAVVRGLSWFFAKPEPLDVRRLGWSEMKQGVAFGVLLAFTFLF